MMFECGSPGIAGTWVCISMCLLDEMGTSKFPHGFMARVWFYLWARLWVAAYPIFAALRQLFDDVRTQGLSAECIVE